MPSSYSHLASAYRRFEEWTKIYGPVFSLRQGSTTIVIVGRYQAAVEIMEREGASLVDRPVSIAAGETLSGGMRMLLTPAGERFKKMRKSVSLYTVVCQPPLTAVVLRGRGLHTH